MSKHTPGPFTVSGRTIYAGKLQIGLAYAEWDAEVGLQDMHGKYLIDNQDNTVEEETAQANADLWAAAPELLEALQKLLRHIEAGDVHPYDLSHARAAIARAEGRTA